MQSSVAHVIERATWAFERRAPVDGMLSILKDAMDRLDAAELEIPTRFSAFNRQSRWHVDELHVHRYFQLNLFLLPHGNSIPLHGHPLMTVLMRVLTGAARVKAYDWAEEHPWSGLARPTYDRVIREADGSLLVLPKRGNVHSVEALEDCAFVDLVYPPYSEQDGRPCHYYREGDDVSVGDETLTRLVRR